jgi:hypothetical protein
MNERKDNYLNEYDKYRCHQPLPQQILFLLDELRDSMEHLDHTEKLWHCHEYSTRKN